MRLAPLLKLFLLPAVLLVQSCERNGSTSNRQVIDPTPECSEVVKKARMRFTDRESSYDTKDAFFLYSDEGGGVLAPVRFYKTVLRGEAGSVLGESCQFLSDPRTTRTKTADFKEYNIRDVMYSQSLVFRVGKVYEYSCGPGVGICGPGDVQFKYDIYGDPPVVLTSAQRFKNQPSGSWSEWSTSSPFNAYETLDQDNPWVTYCSPQGLSAYAGDTGCGLRSFSDWRQKTLHCKGVDIIYEKGLSTIYTVPLKDCSPRLFGVSLVDPGTQDYPAMMLQSPDSKYYRDPEFRKAFKKLYP